MARDRPRRRDLSLGQFEEAVNASVGMLGRDIRRSMDAPILRRLQRSAAVMGCGLVLLLVEERVDDR